MLASLLDAVPVYRPVSIYWLKWTVSWMRNTALVSVCGTRLMSPMAICQRCVSVAVMGFGPVFRSLGVGAPSERIGSRLCTLSVLQVAGTGKAVDRCRRR